jgi:hypothetical protein
MSEERRDILRDIIKEEMEPLLTAIREMQADIKELKQLSREAAKK